MYRPRRGGRSRGYVDPYLLAIVFNAARGVAQMERKPPITLALIAAQTALHYDVADLQRLVPSITAVCLNPNSIVEERDWKRFFLSPFIHADDHHLIYNMVSFLWKGAQLESSMGSEAFLKMLAALLLLSQSLIIGVSFLLSRFFDYHAPYYAQCMVGFSGIIFALKVILNQRSPAWTNVLGIPIPSKYACWAELVYIQLITPHASFLGHLCGILAGLVYLYLPRLLHARGLFFPRLGGGGAAGWGRRGRVYGRGTTGGGGGSVGGRGAGGNVGARGAAGQRPVAGGGVGGVGGGLGGVGTGGGAYGAGFGASTHENGTPQGSDLDGPWTCNGCTYHNTRFLSTCEMCDQSRFSKSGSSSEAQVQTSSRSRYNPHPYREEAVHVEEYAPSAPPPPPPPEHERVDEQELIRRRRLARFQ